MPSGRIRGEALREDERLAPGLSGVELEPLGEQRAVLRVQEPTVDHLSAEVGGQDAAWWLTTFEAAQVDAVVSLFPDDGRHGVEDEAVRTRDHRRPAMAGVQAVVQGGQRRGRPTRDVDDGESTPEARRVDDPPVAGEGSAAGREHVGDLVDRSAGQVQAAQVQTREEADLPAVGTPEGEVRLLGAGERLGLELVEPAEPELPLSVRARCGEHDHRAVGRDHRGSGEVSGEDDLRPGRGLDGDVQRTGRGHRVGLSQEHDRCDQRRQRGDRRDHSPGPGVCLRAGAGFSALARAGRAGARLHRARIVEEQPRFTDIPQALPRVLDQTAPQECGHRRRQRRKRVVVRLVLEDRGEDVGEALAREGAPPGQAFVEHASEGPHVDAPVDGTTAGLLGRHVGGRAQQASGLRGEHAVRAGVGVLLAHGSRQAEVEQLDLAVGSDARVVGLEVAVNHARLVGGLQPVRDAGAERQGLGRR